MTRLRLSNALGPFGSAPRLSFRIAMLVFAFVLGLVGLWAAVPQLIRPRLPFFPVTPADTHAFLRDPDSVARAAHLGFLRGDLWADYALALAGELGPDATPNQDKLSSATSVAAQAAGLAPLDSRAWLILADLASRSNARDRDIAGPLRMSLMTGPNALDLIARRIAIATQSDAISNPEIQELIARDIKIAGRQPHGAVLIVDTYRLATRSGKAFIEQAIRQFDPALWSGLQSKYQLK